MNELFVNVKVDREERPDVDAIYMDAVQAMTGRGGWPMTVFTTPDGRPFYGGTYFPKPHFLQLLAAVDDVWRTKPDDIDQNVRALGSSLDRLAKIAPAPDLPDEALLEEMTEQLIGHRRPPMGRLRRGAEVPLDDEPRPAARPRRRRRRRHHLARRDGQRRDVRPPRRRLRPLLGRRAVAGAALREDALRPGAARAGVHPRRLPPGGHRDDRLRARRAAPSGRRVLLRRGRRLARRARPRPRGPVLRVDARAVRRRARRRLPPRRSSGTSSTARPTSRADGSPAGCTTGATWSVLRTSSRPASGSSPLARRACGRVSTTRCSPSGTG